MSRRPPRPSWNVTQATGLIRRLSAHRGGTHGRPDRGASTRRLILEALEERLCLDSGQIAVSFHEYSIPTLDSEPQYITTNPDGGLWFTEGFGNKIGRLDPATGNISEYEQSEEGSSPTGIV